MTAAAGPARANGRPAGAVADLRAPTTAEKVTELRRRRAEAEQPGSPRAARRLAARGRMTARERILALLDPDSFVETDRLARRDVEGYAGPQPPGDGVITGFGTVDGRQVCVYAHDATHRGGSAGAVFGAKVCKILDHALHVGCPVVGINDSSGARVEEGVLALAAYGEVARRMVTASGVIPQISLIMGVCAGGAVYTPAFTDFVVMVENTSHMFVTGPDVIRAVTGERVSMEALGGATVHATRSGNAHYAAASEAEAIDYVRDLLSYLPANNLDPAPVWPPASLLEPTAADRELDTLVPDRATTPFDMHEVLRRIVDDGDLLPVHPDFAPNIICGFARVDGVTVGVVANQPLHLAGAIDIDAAEKAARFVRFCDSFNIPVLTLVDVPGYLPGTAQEHQGIIRRGAKLAFAYIEATVPKITIVVRRAFGGGYAVMGSRELGADLCFAWPTAQIGVMGAAGGVALLHQRTLAQADDPALLRQVLVHEYEDRLLTPYRAAEHGCVDDLILPSETRPTVVRALRALVEKRVIGPAKKHGNIPL
ncbi:acyl-CoA carboxylase subunit beta [Micromonospora sp. NPDC002717]|uniref:acyl-CoA carboxylase subunit beta n=1 Tax=Micromonospora sp. NPDC002717 TaxID=3154424 RepID=UPI0033232B28